MAIARENVFLYVVPESYLDEIGDGNYVAWDFGQGLAITIAGDIGSSVRGISPNELESLGFLQDEIWSVAIHNVDRLFQSGEFQFKLGNLTSGVEAFIVCNHWLASAFTLHPACFGLAREALGSDSLRVLLPSRDNAIIVRAGDYSPDDLALLELYGELQNSSRKPFPFNVFILTPEGAQDVQVSVS